MNFNKNNENQSGLCPAPVRTTDTVLEVCPVFGKHIKKRHIKGRFCACSIRTYTYVDHGYEVYVWYSPCGDFRLIASCLLHSDWFSFLQYSDQIVQMQDRPKTMCCLCLSLIRSDIEFRGMPVVMAVPPKDLTKEGIEPNPGPDCLWEVREYCARLKIQYSATFLQYGAQHDPRFICTIHLNGEAMVTAIGLGKKASEHLAAEKLHDMLFNKERNQTIDLLLDQMKEIQMKLHALGVEKSRWVKDLTQDGDVEKNPGPFMEEWWAEKWLLCTECCASLDFSMLEHPERCHPGFACAFLAYPLEDVGYADSLVDFQHCPERYIGLTHGLIGIFGRGDEDLWAMQDENYQNYYQWLPNELRLRPFVDDIFLENCSRVAACRNHDAPLVYLLWDEGMFDAKKHAFVVDRESEINIARFRLRQRDIYEYAGEKPWHAWYNFFRAFKVDYDLDHHLIVEKRGLHSLHELCNMPITEGNRWAKHKYGMNIKHVLQTIRSAWVRDLSVDGDVEANPGPWSDNWLTFAHVVKKMKKAQYPNFDDRARLFLTIFNKDTVDDCCDCELNCGRSHSWGYYFKFVNAIIDEFDFEEPPKSDSVPDPSFHSKQEESVYSVPSDEKYKKPPSGSEGQKFNRAKPSRSENIVRTALSNRSLVYTDAEVAILVAHFDLRVFWCTIDKKLTPPFCHPNHRHNISMLHDTITAIQSGAFVLGNPRPEEILADSKPPPRAETNRQPAGKRSHPRSKRSHNNFNGEKWFPSGLNNNKDAGGPTLPPKWAFLEKYWDTLRLSDDIGAGVGLSHELLAWWRMREVEDSEDFELLVIGWAEYAFFKANAIPTVKPNSIDMEEKEFRSGLHPREESVDFVLGPAPYANKLGFFFNEMWLPEHYDALKNDGYYPCWMHQEFCFYRKGEQEWHYLEPRFGIRQVVKTPLIKWLWTLEEMSALVVLVDLDCPDLFLNLVQVSDGSYGVAGRKCRSLNNSYANYWNVIIDGTVLYQGMKAARLNEQQMMAAHCTNESITFLRGWITNSRIIRGLQAVLEHEDIRGQYDHTFNIFGRDQPRTFPNTKPPPDRETRRNEYDSRFGWMKDWLTSPEEDEFFHGFDGLVDAAEHECAFEQAEVPIRQKEYDEFPASYEFYCEHRDEFVEYWWTDFADFYNRNLFPEETFADQVGDLFADFRSAVEILDFDLPEIKWPLQPKMKTDDVLDLLDEEEGIFEIEIDAVQTPWYGGTMINGNYEFPEPVDHALHSVGNFIDVCNEAKEDFVGFIEMTRDVLVLGGFATELMVVSRAAALHDVCVEYYKRGASVVFERVEQAVPFFRAFLIDCFTALNLEFERVSERIEEFFSRLSDPHSRLEDPKINSRAYGWFAAGCALLARIHSNNEVAMIANLAYERRAIQDLRPAEQEWTLSSVRNFCQPWRRRYINGIGPEYISTYVIDSPIISQMNTTVSIEGQEFSIYEPAPYDPERLKVNIFFNRDKFPAVRPECMYWAYVVDLYVPSPHSGLWTTVYRCGKTPPKCDVRRTMQFKSFAEEVFEGMSKEMVVEWRSTSWEGLTAEILRETMENMAAKQAQLRFDDFEACLLGEKKADSHHNRAFTKLDENPGGAKPRHIFNATHWAFQNLQSGLSDIKKALKKEVMIEYDGFHFMMPQPHVFTIRGKYTWTVFVTYMADTDQIQDAAWMANAMNAQPGEIHIAVGGDDNTAVANIDGVLYQIEGDLSMCDQSMHEVMCKLFIQFCALLGASQEFLDVLKESYRNPCIFFYKPDVHTPPEVIAVIQFLVWMLFTGSSQTSCHNTVLLFVIVAWALCAWATDCARTGPHRPEQVKEILQRNYEFLGMKMKLHVYLGHRIMATYHKKYFIRHSNGIVTTSFLIGASLPRILRVRSTTPITEKVFWDRISDGASSRLPVVAHPKIHEWLSLLAAGKMWRPGELIYKGVSSLDVGSKYAKSSAREHEAFWMDRYDLSMREVTTLLTSLPMFFVGQFYDTRLNPELQGVFQKMWDVDNG